MSKQEKEYPIYFKVPAATFVLSFLLFIVCAVIDVWVDSYEEIFSKLYVSLGILFLFGFGSSCIVAQTLKDD